MLRKVCIGAGVVAIAMVLGTARIAYAGGSAPTAIPDLVQTHADTPVDIDPTANDQVDPPFFVDHIEIQSGPSHGTAVVNPDGLTIHYEPETGFTSQDSIQYLLVACADVAQTQVAVPHQEVDCQDSSADIVINVSPVDPTTTVPPSTTTVTVTPLSASTTVAAAAPNELPRTGAGSVPFGWGIAALAVGLATIGLARTRRRV